MFWKKGLNRIFIVLSIVAFFLGAIIGFSKWSVTLTPTAEDVFSTFDWNDKNINKYYEVAKKDFETFKIEKAKNKKNSDAPIDILRSLTWESEKNCPSPSDFKKIPPRFDPFFFSKAFPKATQSPMYKIILYSLLAGVVFFSICYGGLRLISFTIYWIINGFKK